MHVTMDIASADEVRTGRRVAHHHQSGGGGLHRRSAPVGFFSTLQSAITGRVFPMERSCRTIRAAGRKLSSPGEPAADFRIDGPELHAVWMDW